MSTVRERIDAPRQQRPGLSSRKTGEYVILGAHYDISAAAKLISMAPSQIGQIHPGADDNASGTAGSSNSPAFLPRSKASSNEAFFSRTSPAKS